MPTIQKTIRMYNFIKGYIASNHEAPTFHELARRFEFKSVGSVFDHLKKMEERGWIKRKKYVARGIEIVDQDQKIAA